MEYLPGGSLAEHLTRKGALSWQDAVLVLRDAADAFSHAHAARLIHRDLKPANLMRTATADIKLVDFGLAHAPLIAPNLSVASAFVGSPSYVSPEQAAPSPANAVTPRSDLYSLGCTLFALLPRRPSFVADDPAEILYDHQHTPLPDPHDRADHPIPTPSSPSSDA